MWNAIRVADGAGALAELGESQACLAEASRRGQAGLPAEAAGEGG